MTETDYILGLLSKRLVDTEDYITQQFKRLSDCVKSAYNKSIRGTSIYEDPCTEISMGQRIPNPIDLFSCTNHLLLKDWTENEVRYQKQSEDPSTSILLDIRSNHSRIGQFIQYQEEKFIKERELEFREKKREILLNAGVLSPQKPVHHTLIMSQFRIKSDQPGKERKGKSSLKQGKTHRYVSIITKKFSQDEIEEGCVVCVGEDYEDDNLIVYCAVSTFNAQILQKCNLQVHQQCYGLEEIPSDDFVCQTCQAFDEYNKLVPCALCSLKGGVMRPTTLKSKEKIGSQKTKKQSDNQKSSKFSIAYTYIAVISSYIKKEREYQAKCQSLRNAGQLTADYFQTYYQWVHLSCVFWISEINLPQKAPIKISRSQIEHRTKLNCIICQQKGRGACIQCCNKGCTTSFHVECARKARYYMEYSGPSDDQDSFSIFCLRHRPFPLRKEIERNERLTEDEITHFCELFDNSLFEWKNMKKWSDKDKRELLSNIGNVYFYMRKLRITLFKQLDFHSRSQTLSELFQSDHNPKPCSLLVKQGRYSLEPKPWNVILDPPQMHAFPWKYVKFRNYTTKDCYYMCKDQLIKDEESFVKRIVGDKYQEKYEQFKKRLQKQEEKIRDKEKILKEKEDQEKMEQGDSEEELESTTVADNGKRGNKSLAIPPLPDEPQCYCKKKVANLDNSILCLNGESNCPYGGYFHQSCIRKFDYKVDIKAGFKYMCKACKRLGPAVASKMSKLNKSAKEEKSRSDQACKPESFGKAIKQPKQLINDKKTMMLGTFTDGSTLTCSVNDSTCSNNSRSANNNSQQSRTIVTKKKKSTFAYGNSESQQNPLNDDIKGDDENDSEEEEMMVDIIFSK
ncbi:hypothetical protein FGO68_gene11457 [Halteria grandinella]|uniref:PHD-type domain-containing protein n=1 Tax=Halteria grandinella TaxID=5974 RepID=A0A8J8P3S3_HALGN|nr:hypothetical protein FGO68_gene11457 [Halteria grandinella]